MTINSIENGRPIQDRKANIDNLLNKLRNEMNELSEQGNDITQKLCLVYSSIDQLIVSDQQLTSTSSEDAEELSSRKERKTSTSSREEERSQLESSESNSGTSSTNSHSTNESNSNEDINENILESSCKKENEILKKELEQNLKVEELYKRIPELETLYATVSKNLKHNDRFELMNNQLNDLFTNNKNYTKWNSGCGRNRLNSKFSRKTSLSARTTPIQQQHQLNGTTNGAECEELNRKSFLSNLHSNLVNGAINNSSNTNYYSDADSISYETIDYLGSNSIDSGYKSCKESCCPTPDYHHNHTINAPSIDQRNCRAGGGRFSLDASSVGFNSSTISQYGEHNNLDQASNEKFIKQYQELIAKSNSSTLLKNNLIMMNKNNRLINPNELQKMINDPVHTSTNAINSIQHSNNSITLNNEIDDLDGQSLMNGHTTFKSALALKLSNPRLNAMDTDYYTIGRYNRHHLSQSEQYLNNLNSLNDDSIYPYLINSTKSRNLFKNRSNLNLEQYLNKIKQQNDLLKQEIEQKEQLNRMNNCSDLNLNHQFSQQPTKVVKRKLPQINHLYSRSEMARNRLYASKQLHSSDLNMNSSIDQFKTNKYEHQARFRSIYAANNKLRRQPLSASITQIEQASNLESIYYKLNKPNPLSNSLDGEDSQSLANDYNQLFDSNLINRNLYSNDNKQRIDRLYSQVVQKNQQKSSSSASIYYQDYLDNQQQAGSFKNSTNTFHNTNGPTASSLTTQVQTNLTTQKNSPNNLSIKQELSKEELNDEKRIKQQQKEQKNFDTNKNSKEYKTRSTDDLYKSMSDLVNNRFNQLNNANSKRRAFKLTSPLKTLSKAFSSEAADIFKMKELAKSKFANLIDNFASSNSNKKQDKQNKSPIKSSSKKPLNKQSSNHHSANASNLNEQAGNIYSHEKHTNSSVSNLQKQPLPPIPVVEHLYEELKIMPTKERKNDLPEIRVSYCKQRSTVSSSNKEDNLTKQSKSLEETTSNSKDPLIDFKQYSRSLDQEYEDEIIRKINSDETIKQIENVISNIDTMLNNKENLNLEFRV